MQQALTQPEHVGDIDSYAVMHSYHIPNDIYPVSIVYLVAHLVDIKAILLTKAVLDVVSNGTPITVMEEGAILNEKDFKDNINSLTPFAVLSQEYLLACQAQGRQPNPLQFITRQVDGSLNVALANMLDRYIEEMNGNVGAAKGVPDYSNMSGVQTSALQSAAMILTKTEELAYQDFAKKLGEILIRYVVDFRDYEHTIPSAEGRVEVVNQGGVTTWDYDNYYIEPIVMNNPTAIEQLKEQQYQQWASAGWIHPVDAMEKAGENRAGEMYDRALEHNNLLVVKNAMEQRPEIAEAIMQLISQSAQAGNKEQAV
jgi:hypothetical protein